MLHYKNEPGKKLPHSFAFFWVISIIVNVIDLQCCNARINLHFNSTCYIKAIKGEGICQVRKSQSRPL